MRFLGRGERASTLDYLVAGLGNPGRRVRARPATTSASWSSDELARRHGAGFRSKFSGRVADIRHDGVRLALLEPQTYMNESGRSVAAALRFYKTPLDRLLVVHDEVDLEFGRLQARLGGGLAGHNGLRSIADNCGGSDFLRLRIGVGRPERGDPRPVADYVLSPFAPDLDVDAIVTRAADAVETLVTEGLDDHDDSLQRTRPRAVTLSSRSTQHPRVARRYADSGWWHGVAPGEGRRARRRGIPVTERQ